MDRLGLVVLSPSSLLGGRSDQAEGLKGGGRGENLDSGFTRP